MSKAKKIKCKKEIEIKVKLETGELLSYLVGSEVSFKQILLQLCACYWVDGAYALSGLPIITNERSCQALENSLICKYVVDNWDEVSKKAVKYYAKFEKAEEAKSSMKKK